MLCLTGIILALLHLKTGSPGLGFAYIQKTIYGGKLFLQPRNRLLVRKVKVKVEKKDTKANLKELKNICTVICILKT